ncbi:hypothetical protein ABE67_22915 [Cytobacillus firmus]|uniref:lipopolysaccharide biosynthesis protein n=1 Tax=Cytobacillus firmus TaxID=1399 RepID=UPI0018CE8BE7|nr:oligosaccharide flippase family protein [Cytobacillus firmus]MBG9452131.1 hypothetical protein [Cytobacillus firmus]
MIKNIFHKIKNKKVLDILINDILFIALRIVLSVLLARLLTKEQYGSYNYFISLLTLVSIFSLPGMNQAITNSISNGRYGILKAATFVKLKYSILGILFLITFLTYELLFRNPETSTIIMYIVCIIMLVPFNALTSYTSFYNGVQDYKGLKRTNINLNIFIIITTISITILTKNVVFALTTYLVGVSLFQFFIYIKQIKQCENEEYLEKDIRFGKSFSGINAILHFSNNIERILIAHFLGLEMLAIYTVASAIPNQFRRISGFGITYLFPKISALNEYEAIKTIKQYRLKLNVFYFSIGLIGILVSPILIVLLYGEKYNESVIYTQLFFLVMTMNLTNSTLTKLLLPALQKTKLLLQINLIMGILNIIGYLVLIPIFDIMGVIYSQLVSTIAGSIIGWSKINKLNKL